MLDIRHIFVYGAYLDTSCGVPKLGNDILAGHSPSQDVPANQGLATVIAGPFTFGPPR